jgi:DeoR/GlpR family transcriptional regulator of sugar metabolism
MRVPLQIIQQRREKLRALIRTDGFLPVADICRRLGVSEATARRDLSVVSASGQITRTRGGALADYNAAFASVGERAGRARTAKERIAAAAVEVLPRKGIVFLDAGTTVQAVARQLLHRRRFKGLAIVTNSLPVATMLGGASGLELHMLGGAFLHRQAALLGRGSVMALANWRFNAAFLGGEGMGSDGVTNSHEELAVFQRAVLLRSSNAYFCLDATKLGLSTPHIVTPWGNSFSLITDAKPAQLANFGIRVSGRRLVSV